MMNLDQQEPLEQNERTAKELQQRSQRIQPQESSSMGLLAEVTTLAWNLVIPIVGGVLLGYYLDHRAGNDFKWTLSLLVLGVLIAFSNLYNLYIEHGRQHHNEDHRHATDKVTHDKEE